MMVVRLQGGLGNQISQYAFSRWLKAQYPQVEVKLDMDWYETSGSTIGFEMDRAFFGENLVYSRASHAEREEVTGIKGYGQRNPKLNQRLRNKALRGIRKVTGQNPVIVQAIQPGYPEPANLYTLDGDRNWYFDGYWHSIDYTEILPQLRVELKYREPESEELLMYKDKISSTEFSVSLHVRLGDYRNTPRDILMNSGYYRNAVRFIAGQRKTPVFYIFSNELDAAEEYWAGLGFSYEYHMVSCTERPAYTDMILMGQCHDSICANSTYSYWAALLGHTPSGVITIPEEYVEGRAMWKNPLCATVSL